MTDFSITITGTRATLDKLKRTSEGILDLTHPLRKSGELLKGFYQGAVFASRGRVIGLPWPRLKPETERQKDLHWSGRPPLVRTGNMQDSFRFESGPTSLRVFNDVRSTHGFNYFRAHQMGTRRIPRRAMMALDDQRIRAIVGFIQLHLSEQIEGR